MGLQHLLQGVTFECPSEAAGQPKLVRCLLEGKQYSSTEIDKIFSASKAQGKSLYYVDEALLQSIAPDLIFTQDVCEVCQIDTVCTAAAIAHLPKQPQVIALTPNNLDDVFNTAVTIATALGHEEAAYAYLARLQQRLDAITDSLRRHRSPVRRVSLLEWIAPVYNCGHWIPFQVAAAGGTDMLGNPGGDSIVTQWERIVKYNPEVLVVAPCGFTTSRSMEEMHLLTEQPGWGQLQAVQKKQVYVADYDLFTQPSPSTLTDGIELLAALFHPGLFAVPERLQHHYRPFYQSTAAYAQA
jgi:iron complex transport system substrate-binding protein